MDKIKFCCPCHFGLESVLKFEITKIGGEDINVSDGRITFTGDFSVLARANLCLATAERVLIQMSEFKATTFEELFQGVKAIPFEDFIGKNDSFPVKGYSLNSSLHSVPDCQAIIKKAIAAIPKQRSHIPPNTLISKKHTIPTTLPVEDKPCLSFSLFHLIFFITKIMPVTSKAKPMIAKTKNITPPIPNSFIPLFPPS